MNKESPGIKHDQGKPMFSLMPPLSELEVVKVLTFGAEKYAPDNWKKIEQRRYVDAAGRHINAHRIGERHDRESGLHHLAHAICCLMFQLEKELEVGAALVEASEEHPLKQTQTYAPEKEYGYYSHPPAIGQEYYYLSNTGALDVRRWQSTPQEWKRLENKQVFYDDQACKNRCHSEEYIFHEDDPVAYPEIGKEFHYVYLSGLTGSWRADSMKINSSSDLGVAEEIHEARNAATTKEQAEAKAFWRNTSTKRHSTPYGPLHQAAIKYLVPKQCSQSKGDF